MTILLFFSIVFTIALVMISLVLYRIICAVPHQDRTYADQPPGLLRKVWSLVEIIAFYVGPYLSVEYREKTIRRLRKAELDYTLSPQQWISAQIVYAILVSIGTTVLGLWLGVRSFTWPVVGALCGFFYVELWLRERIKIIEMQILKSLPNFLDMLTLAIESGCNLTVGINIAVEKSSDSPLKRAFTRLLREIRSGRTRIDALRALEERLAIASVTSMTTALVQSEKTGANLGVVLRAQSTQRTNERFARAEKLAMEAPVKMLGPLILCIFPCTFLVLGFPIAMKLMHAFQ